MEGIWLLLGTNLGDRKRNLEKALKLLREDDLEIIEHSSIYESEPWGIHDQPWFWNMVIKVKTALDPISLLKCCLAVEAKMGRVRTRKWGERLIDIDILYYEDQVINTPHLKIPHPGITERKFTLMPLAEKWPTQIHPTLKKSQSELLDVLDSSLVCRKTDVVLAL